MENNVVWKDVTGFEGLYQVNNLGDIYSLRTRILLKHADNGRGYDIVCLRKDKKSSICMVHRLVAFAFISNDDLSKDEINHINENKKDNRVENLEWCDRKYNNNFGSRTEKHLNKLKKPVEKLSMDNIQLEVYLSAKEASLKCEIPYASMKAACNGRLESLKGFKWRYI